jgi:hypothetical protein
VTAPLKCEAPGGNPAFRRQTTFDKSKSKSSGPEDGPPELVGIRCSARHCSRVFQPGGSGVGRGSAAMSRQAIAAALARQDLCAGERLVAFSLASFADRENRAWPGAAVAAARAGLGKSRYLQAREQLVRGGLVTVADAATGRGRASTLALTFADAGPWWDGEINPELFEAVLGYSRARGPARLLLAGMAALADEDGVVEDLTTEQLCKAVGLADRTYRRARRALLGSGELILISGVGGRGNTNRWEIPDPQAVAGEAIQSSAARRVPPPAGARPLVAAVTAVGMASSSTSRELATGGVAESNCRAEIVAMGKGGQGRTLSPGNRPTLTGVSGQKSGHDRTLSPQNRPILTGVSGVKGGQDQTLFGETPAERAVKTPAKTPAPIARAGKEPQNRRTKEHPPTPLKGGGRRTRSRSRRPTQPGGAEDAADGSTSTSTRSAARSAYRDRLTTPTGTVVAKRLGRSRADIMHTVRLLDLPDEAIQLIDSGELTKGHGKALLTEPDHHRRRTLAGRAADAGWSIRTLEAEISRAAQPRQSPLEAHPDHCASAVRLQDAIIKATGCDARARPHRHGYQVIMDQAAADRLAKLLDADSAAP